MFRDLVIVIIIIKSFPRYSSRISSPHNIIIPQEERIALHVCPRPEKFTRDPSVCATFDRIFYSTVGPFSYLRVTKTGGRI